MKSKRKLIFILGLSFIVIFIVGFVLSTILNKEDKTPPVSFDTYITTNIGQIEDKGNYYLAQKKNVYIETESMSKECTNIMNGIVECFTEFPLDYNPYDPYDEYPSWGDYLIDYNCQCCGFSGMNYHFLIVCKSTNTNLVSFAVFFSDEVDVSNAEFINSLECAELLNNL